MNLSIVATLYRSAPYVQEFYDRICAAAAKITNNFEIVLVNDGSPDNSLEIAQILVESDQRVRVVDLSRNFGHHKAMMTGLMHARGDLVFLIDSDLEEEPELLLSFAETMESSKADVVYGIQERRKGGAFERISGRLYFTVFNLFSSQPIPPNHLTARLMTRRYVDALIQHQESEFVMSFLFALAGFSQVAVSVRKHDKATSSYGLRQKIAHLVNAVTASSSKPLILIFYLGCLILIISSVAALDLLIRKIAFGALLEGWASLIISLWLLGGITIFCLGVIGIYLSKIFSETKQRPYTIVRHIYENRGGGAADYVESKSAEHKEESRE